MLICWLEWNRALLTVPVSCCADVTMPPFQAEEDVLNIHYTQINVFIGVCWLAGLCKTTEPIFTKFGEKVTPGPQNKLLDFCDNSDHITLVRVRIICGKICVTSICLIITDLPGRDMHSTEFHFSFRLSLVF